MLKLHVLGAFDVRSDGPAGSSDRITQPKRLALLLYLALSQPAGLQARERLLALLWPDADDASSRHSLRNALHALRQALGEDAIVTRGDSYVGLAFESVQCDALDLRAHVAAGRLDDAIALWKGDLVPGFHVTGAPDFEHWLDEQRMELRRDVRAAAWKRAKELAGTGAAETDAIRRALRLDPGNEPGTRRLMQLLDAAGDRGGALRAYREVADFFSRELETQPSAETNALAATLRASPVRARATPAPAELRAVAVPAPDREPEPLASPARHGRRSWLGVALTAGALATLAVGASTYSPRAAEAGGAPPWSASDEAERTVLRLPARYRADTSAYSSYLRGLTLRFRFHFLDSRDTLAALVDRKPLYVPGLAGLAHAYVFTTLNYMTGVDESWPKIEALANRALALDSSTGSAWLALAASDMFNHPDLPRARERIARARALDPRDPDAEGMQSVWFRFHGQMDSAVGAAQRAHELDPLSQFFARLVGRQLYFAHRLEESRSVYVSLLRDEPQWKRGYADMGDLYRALGRPRDAVEWYRRAALAGMDTARAAALQAASTDAQAAQVLAADSRRTIARLEQSARGGEAVSPSLFALEFAALRDTNATLSWLDSMAVHHDSYLHQVRVDPVFDFVRTDARYKEWEAKSGLPPLSHP